MEHRKKKLRNGHLGVSGVTSSPVGGLRRGEKRDSENDGSNRHEVPPAETLYGNGAGQLASRVKQAADPFARFGKFVVQPDGLVGLFDVVLHALFFEVFHGCRAGLET